MLLQEPMRKLVLICIVLAVFQPKVSTALTVQECYASEGERANFASVLGVAVCPAIDSTMRARYSYFESLDSFLFIALTYILITEMIRSSRVSALLSSHFLLSKF